MQQGNKAVIKSVVAHETGGTNREEIFVDVIEKISVTFNSSAAKEIGALQAAKSKLEKEVEELTRQCSWRNCDNACNKQLLTENENFSMAKRRMSLQMLLYITLSLWAMTPMAFAVCLSKPNCQEKCGNVIIPYPFGIGQGCSANSSFTVSYQNITNLETPFLSSLNLEVLQISANYSTITLNQPVSPLNRSLEQKGVSLGKSLSGTPFIFSRLYSVLAVLGCNNVVTLLPNGTTTAGGCVAICGHGSNSIEGCNVVNYCKANIALGLQEPQVIYRTIEGNNNTSSCGYAFLVDENWLQNDYRNYTGLHDVNPFDRSFVNAPVVLEWRFPTRSSTGLYCEYRSLGPYYSGWEDQSDYYSLLRQCICMVGFEGNPYVDEGCQDIDECSNSNLNFCQGGCTNTVGSYRCSRSRVKMIFIGVGAGLGALLLLVGPWWSYKVIRKRIKSKRKQKFFKRNGGLLLEQQLSSTQNGVERAKLFNSKELEQATDHFNVNRILGIGGQGTVYKGMLSDGRIVAVKKSQKVDEDDLKVFINEKYHLALSYLHSAESVPIYHRDIKSTNVLLDDKYRAKVSDFGTSRSVSIDQTHLTTKVIGTFGYLDPE
ncbi:Wall-associated receptor kinase-like 2 [Forsythia ovata]|uniref:Wall-associated receptor kinase-like 2 n=1 Tax=Forsythia ovata TaxID=205694 RepID=A0ABD1W926_9LAMI